MINLAVMVRRHDPVYPLVFVWAAAAIHTGHADDELVATTSLVCAIVVGVAEMVALPVWIIARRRDADALSTSLK